MATLTGTKLSQIAPSGTNFTSTDTVIGVRSGTTDLRWSFTQLAAGVSTAISLIISTTPIIGGSNGHILYDNNGVIGEASGLIWDVSNQALNVSSTSAGT